MHQLNGAYAQGSISAGESELQLGVLAWPLELRLPAERLAVELLGSIDVADCEDEMRGAVLARPCAPCNAR